jgi:hypothetical protein
MEARGKNTARAGTLRCAEAERQMKYMEHQPEVWAQPRFPSRADFFQVDQNRNTTPRGSALSKLSANTTSTTIWNTNYLTGE